MRKLADRLLKNVDIASVLVVLAVTILVARNLEVFASAIMALSTPGFSEGGKVVMSVASMAIASLGFPLVLIGLAKVIRLLEENKDNA